MGCTVHLMHQAECIWCAQKRWHTLLTSENIGNYLNAKGALRAHALDVWPHGRDSNKRPEDLGQQQCGAVLLSRGCHRCSPLARAGQLVQLVSGAHSL